VRVPSAIVADVASPAGDAPDHGSAPLVREAVAAEPAPFRAVEGVALDASGGHARNTWRYVLAGGLVVGALAVLWVAVQRPTGPPGDDAVRARTASASEPLDSASTATSATPGPHAAPDAASRAAGPAAPSDASRAEQVQFCGSVWVPQPADGSPVGDGIGRVPSLLEARARILGAMRSDPDPYSQAVGAWLGDGQPVVDETSGYRLWKAPVEELAALAVRSSDPRVYALARGVCKEGHPPGEGSCALLSAAQWARLDPDNGYAWLAVAEDARAQGDHAAMDDAIHHLSVAPRYESGIYDPLRIIVGHAGQDDASTVAAWLLVSQSVGMEAAFVPPYDVLMRGCRVRMEEDPNRWQTCSAAASALAERSDTLLDRSRGRALGRRLGWPQERQDRLAGEAARWMSEEAVWNNAGKNTATCDGLRNFLAHASSGGRGGEVGALQVALAARAVSDEELVRLGRAERERREQAAPASTAASGAASAGVAERAPAASASTAERRGTWTAESAHDALAPR
jgi:hypothetical protein